MDDSISRQDAIEGADRVIARDKSGNNDVVNAMTAWKEWIKALPSVQPDIIHCKDCNHHDTHNHRCKYWNHGVKADDYCSFAERKEDGKG